MISLKEKGEEFQCCAGGMGDLAITNCVMRAIRFSPAAGDTLEPSFCA